MSSSSNVVIKSKDVRSREELAELLSTLAERIRSGRVSFNQGPTGVELELPRSLHVDLEIKDTLKPSRTKRELEIEIWWDIDDQGRPIDDPGTGGGVTIT